MEKFIVWICASIWITGCTISASVHNGELKASLHGAESHAYFTNKSPVKVRVHFNRAPEVVHADQFQAQNATISGITHISGSEYIIELIPTTQGIITITCSGDILANTTADASGDFSMELGQALTTEGTYAWSALAEDAAGNTYCYPYPLAYTLDQTAPIPPA